MSSHGTLSIRAITEAKKALEQIPPDERGEIVINILDDLTDLAQIEARRARPISPVVSHKVAESDLEFSLKEFRGKECYENFLEALKQATSDDVPHWKQIGLVTELLHNATNKDFVAKNNMYLTYEVDDEILSLIANGEKVFSLYDEDTYEELKSSLKTQGWFSPPRSSLPHKPGTVDTTNSMNLLKNLEDKKIFKEISSKPGFVKIGKLFEAFNKVGKNPDFGHRSDPQTGTIYLTYKSVDVVGFNQSNVAWPHLSRVHNYGTGQYSFREVGHWSSMSPDSRIELRARFLAQESGKGSCYFSPLGRSEILDSGQGRYQNG